jgi:hypothetical protein
MLNRLRRTLGLLRTPTYTKYDVKVFVMSEGTAQGLPRPLQVLKVNLLCEEAEILSKVSSIGRYGQTVTRSDGVKVLYPPHTIYKITYEVSNE